jgi:hypothetical protein
MPSRTLISKTDSVKNGNGLSFVPHILTHHKSLAFLSPIVSLFKFGVVGTVVNPTQGGTDYGQSEVCEANASQETGRHGQDGRPGFGRGASNVAITTQSEGESFVTCGTGISQRRIRIRLLAKSVAGFLLRSLCAKHPPVTDPIRHFSFSSRIPRSTSPTTPARPPAQVSSSRVPVSPSTTEILLGIAARLAGVTLLSIWEINDRTLVLFTCQRVCGSTLALDINLFDRAHIKTKVEEAAARFEHRE